MKKIIAFFAGLLVWSVAGLVFAEDGEVTKATLDNGMKVIVVRDSLAPVVTVEVNYLVGSSESPSGFPGTAHALEHMMFRGSPGLSGDQVTAVMSGLGGGFNAQTTQDITQYYASAPAENVELLLHVEALRMRGVNLGEGEWNMERGAIEQEVARDLSDPGFVLHTGIMARLFQGTPYAHTALGGHDSFEHTDVSALMRFHDTWYAPNNAILVITGDVDPQATLAKVRAEFGSIPRRELPKRPSFAFAPVAADTLKLSADSPMGFVALAYRLPGGQSSDYATAQVLAGVLSSQRGPLVGMAMDGTALIGGFVGNIWQNAGLGLAVGGYPRGGDPQPVLKRMQAVLAEAGTKGLDPALIEVAKRKAISDLEFQKNSVAGLANAWSYALAVEGAESPDAVRQAIMAVTPEAVNALARKTFVPEHTLTVILNPVSSGKPISKSGFDAPESFGGSPDRTVELPSWAAQALSQIDPPVSRLSPKAYKLPNGLRLIVQPESISNTVELVGHVRSNGDLEDPPGQEGVGRVLSDLFQFGTRDLDRLQLQQALDAIGAHESAGMHFSLAVPASHFAEGLRILAENELFPALPEAGFRLVKQQEAAATAGVIQSSSFLGNLEINKRLLPRADPYLRYATPESIAGLTLAQVRDYYAKVFRPDLTTIVVVGNIDPATARSLVEKNFGSWRSVGGKPELDYPAVPPNEAASVQVPNAQAQQSSVHMTQWLGVTRADPSRFALTLGDQVLSGGSDSWLFRDLREQRGLVYSVGTDFNLGKRRSFYTVSFGAAPDKVSEARGRVLADLKRLQSEPISDAELRRAKGELLRGIPLREASFSGIAGELLSYAEDDLPLNESMIAAKHYLSLTADDVRDAYAKHIRLDGFVTEIVGPAPQ
ncbi:M16 family metallopeptidase [Burkholderia pseudomallei]|uniref:M16 family metallopeptidase n=1 Tax=Burkholderia pseudomallei TaxID=28450 RepID=UPI0022EA3551|nr:pitrilysin family protein [Burkholderia pseudomallei]